MRAAPFLIWAAICAISNFVRASMQDVIGYGPRSSAMGATGTAVGSGFETVYSNPALLSTAHDRTLSLGFASALFDLQAATDFSYNKLYGSYIGATFPVPFGGSWRDRVTLGLGFFTPFDLVVKGRILYPEEPEFPIADRMQSVTVQAGLGIDVGYGFRVGAGFSGIASLVSTLTVQSGQSDRTGTLVASYSPIVGASYEFLDTYRIGSSFHGELIARVGLNVSLNNLGDVVLPPLNISGIAQYDPMQVSTEFAKFVGATQYAIGFTWKHWSAYPGPAEPTVICPETDPETGDPYEGPCDVTFPPSPNYSDTVSLHLGLERLIYSSRGAEMYLRCGYFFEPSPAPPQNESTNRYDNSRSAFSLGYALELDSPLPKLGLAWFLQYQYLHPRTHSKNEEFEQATVPNNLTSQGDIVAAGMTVRFTY